MPYGDTTLSPMATTWPGPGAMPAPRRRAAGLLPLALATVLSFAAGVGSTVLYLHTGQGEFQGAEVPFIEADKSPTRVRPEVLIGDTIPAPAGPIAAAPRPLSVTPGTLPSPISSALAMSPPVPSIDLSAQGIPTAPEIAPPASAEVVELVPQAASSISAPALASPKPAAAEEKVPSGPQTRLQVASMRTYGKAVEEMNRFKSVHAALVADLEFEVQRLDLGERGVFHRVLSSPVGERAEAVALCAALAERRAQCQVMTLPPRAAGATQVAAAAPDPAPSALSAPTVAAQPVETQALPATPTIAEPTRTEVRAQLATLRTLEGATRELNRLARLHGEVLEQTELSVSRIDQGARGVFYRILTAPLPSRDAAGEFCQRLNASQGAGCVLIPQRSPTA